ncbi:MAG: NAD(FAD)-dependent dehydrogenase [Desulfotomaculum sp. 46_296]|nr:MAG: NAD(FAD)-dependent dehydrogenase [Desulfotomaculum sp. 46_296]
MKKTDVLDVVVIGGGLSGVEFAEQLQKAGKKVTLIEAAQRCVWHAFDDEVCRTVEDDLRSNGIAVMTGTKVCEITGRGKVEAVKLDNGVNVRAGAVILATVVTPNSILAQEAGLSVNFKADFYEDLGCADWRPGNGGDSMGEMINVLGLAIQKSLTANELNTFQVAAHSLITSSPVNYPINAAALDALMALHY